MLPFLVSTLDERLIRELHILLKSQVKYRSNEFSYQQLYEYKDMKYTSIFHFPFIQY